MDDPLVSCIMPTLDSRAAIHRAIEQVLSQNHPSRELVIVVDRNSSAPSLNLPNVRILRAATSETVGAKRNLACLHARGEIILHWDDDDWYAPWRVEYQSSELLKHDADICGLDNLLYYDSRTDHAWRYSYPAGAKQWLAGNTLCYRKSFWNRNPFENLNIGEDARFVWKAGPSKVLRLTNHKFVVGMIHDSNVSPKRTDGPYWKPCPVSEIRAIMAEPRPELPARHNKTAIVLAGKGIGDILRVTPLISVLHRQDYRVDVLLNPDYPESASLLEGAAQVARVWHNPEQLHNATYDLSVSTFWAKGDERRISARKKLSFIQSEWLKYGDSHCVQTIARHLGWTEPIPEPFARISGRQFDLSPDTVAIHPGCKPDWPWKKWHGFDELAAHYPSVAVVGTLEDRCNDGTYFHRPFRWPSHVRDFTGKLSLSDTAALLSQCAALFSNDSGLMHLAAAVGTPSFGIFGITNPDRETMPSSRMFPITKGLPCEPACRRQAWGRRDCEQHLSCLKTLTAAEVHQIAEPVLAQRAGYSIDLSSKEPNTMQRLGLTYHGHVFDSSGYGTAARGYIHALHAAGVDLAVIDLSRHEPQVHDELVASLIGRQIHADFNLFHGIPTIWARDAFRVSNAIGMTVWETDTMPTQWRNTLNHVLQVWLPCDFNVGAFRPDLRRSIFKLPHALTYHNGHQPRNDAGVFLNVAPGDFVVYSIFEWQDRKSPFEQMRAYMRAFPEAGNTVLILKTNAAAREAAQGALTTARSETGSSARVELRCESWDENQILTLHQRGDCYLSLHRGEGWCYPLFEAVCNGKPAVATGYSGPLEYLEEPAHRLVRHRLVPVRQQYRFYHSGMNWAEPDCDHAAQCLREIHDNPETARAHALRAGAAIRARYSPQAIGARAKEGLMELLKRTDANRYRQVVSIERADRFRPSTPIPGEWFDADYFDNGLKSTWERGYRWEDFRGLFRDTATFLISCFPDAASFFDAGCAKGFLVRSLREAGKEAWGCDISRYAIAQTDAAVRPYTEVCAAEDWTPDRRYDMLLAFHLLTQMTEEQARRFLTRSRERIGMGIVAVIESFSGENGAATYAGDLAHITRKSAEWWHDLFLSCGWRQDAFHRSLEQACQRQELPARMGWRLFVYAS